MLVWLETSYGEDIFRALRVATVTECAFMLAVLYSQVPNETSLL